MIITDPAASDDIVRFPSLESLRAAHTELLKRFRVEAGASRMITEVEAFIRRGKQTGALLDTEADRWAAQSQLDYWATQLYKPGYEPPDSTLDEFDPQLAPELDDALCPYMGLDAFREANQTVFFGRERLIGELVAKVGTTRFLPVLGSSGSGKSSLVRAGLLPALKKGELPGSADWNYCAPIVPGSNPLGNLVRLMLPSDADAGQAQDEANRFGKDPAYIGRLVSRRFGSNVVLIIDQFEEIFTLCTDENMRRQFVGNLLHLSQTPDAQHRVIITMRTDFETNIARLADLQAVFDQEAVRITSFSASELRLAIEAPAALIGLKFEEGVVDALLNDTLGEPAALPLLQFTLLKLWESRDRNRVTWEAYKKLGGGRQTLARAADRFYNSLIPEEQVTMRRILLKMVRPGEGLEVTSNRVPRSTLYQQAEASDRIDRVLDRLIRTRLVRVSEGDTAADEQVEVAHEALVRNWPRLVEWLEEERVTLRQRLRLTMAAEEWQRLGQDPSALWRGVVLDEVRRYDDLDELETRFVEAGYEADQDEMERKLAEAQRQKELEYTQKLAETERLRAEEQARSAASLQRRSIYLSVALGIALVAVVIAVFFGAEARMATSIAQENARLARIGELTAQSAVLRDSKPDVSLLLGIELFEKLDNSQTRSVLLDNAQAHPNLLQFLQAHRDAVWSVDFSPDGRTLASASNDGTLIIWDMTTGQPIDQPLYTQTGGIWSVDFSPDGKTLASGGTDGTIILWDVATRKPLGRPLRGHTDQLRSVAFSPDGRTLASGSLDQTVILWDMGTQKSIGEPLRGHTNFVLSVAFSPDGQTLASGSSDQSVILWDVAAHQPIGQPLRGHTGEVSAVAFGPDGKTLASASGDSTVILWNVISQKIMSQLHESFSGVNSVAFSPDGRTLAFAGLDQAIKLWDMANMQPIGQPLHAHTAMVNALAFSPDGRTLVSGSSDTSLILWKVSNQPLIAQSLRGHRDQVRSVAYSPRDNVLASAGGDGAIILWALETHQQIRQPLRGHTDWVNSVAFGPDGKILASGSSDQTVILWNVTTHEPIGQPLRGHTAPVQSVAFSPDGKTLASGSEDESVILWDIATGQPIGQPLRAGPNGGVWSVSFSPDGRMLASGNVDFTITLWDVASHKVIGEPLRGHTDQLRSVAFSPDGKTLASGSLDQSVILWDVATHQQIGQPLRGHTNFVFSTAFSPDGKTLASGSFDQSVILWDVATHQQIGQPLRGQTSVVWSVAFSPNSKTLDSDGVDQTVILWDLDVATWIDLTCQRVGRNFTRAEWIQYFLEEQYRATCPQWSMDSEPAATP